MALPHSFINAAYHIRFEATNVGVIPMAIECNDTLRLRDINPDSLTRVLRDTCFANVELAVDEVGFNHGRAVGVIPLTVDGLDIALNFAFPEADYTNWTEEDKRLYYAELLDAYKDDIIIAIEQNLVGL